MKNMKIMRRGRFLYWLAKDLSKRYTRSLIFGFLIGLVTTFISGRIITFIRSTWFMPTIRIGMVGEFTPTTLPLSIQNHISSGLVTLAGDGSVNAGLASWWESTDSGKAYIFHLKKDAVWHDGKRVTAKDVNYNIKNVLFTDTDAYTVKVSLPDPYSPFLTFLSKPILSRGLIGFGPYKVRTVKLKGSSVDYLKIIPTQNSLLPIIEYRFYHTEKQAITAYKLGNIDQIDDLSRATDMDKWKNTRIEMRTKYDRIVALYFNTSAGILKERNIRQALSYAVPQFSEYERAYSPISKKSWAYTDKIRHYDFNADQATKLLKNAKLFSESATIELSTFSQYLDIAQIIADSWTSMGMKTHVKVENIVPDSYQVLLSAADLPPDPDQYPLWHSTQSQANITKYINVKIDKLLEDGRKESDTEKRKKIYADFQRYLVDDAPADFLFYSKIYTIKRGKD